MEKYVIYSSSLDDTPKEKYAHDGVDAEVGLSKKIAEWLGDGAEAANDSETYEYEILVGEVDRPRAKESLAALELNQYGIFCYENCIAVCGHCAASVLMAGELLMSLDRELLTDGYSNIVTHDAWWIDHPRFTYGEYCGMTDCSYDRIETVYKHTNEANVEAYISELEAAGFESVYSHSIEENRFYRLERDGKFLHITYLGRTGKTEIISGDGEKCKTVTPAQTDTSAGCKVILTQMALDYSGGSFGMCYIIRLEDGSFVIIDGGNVRIKNGYPKTYDYVRLYTLLQELNQREDGQIVISAWFMTHEHADHFWVFYWFCREYGDRVTVKAYYDCTCTDTVSYNSKNPDYHTTRGRLSKAQAWVGGFERVTLMAGDVLEFGNVRFEILYTIDDLFPERLHYFNDSSFVCTMTYGGQKTLWLGDICTAPSRFLRENYSEATLKSDIVQLAHHGLNGAEKELYDIADGEVLLWSLRDKLVDKIFAQEPVEEHQKLAYHLRDEMNVKEIITHTRHNDTFTLPYYTEGGERELL